jgi:hypothetical protein
MILHYKEERQMPIVFSESSNLANTIYGKCEAPVRMFL